MKRFWLAVATLALAVVLLVFFGCQAPSDEPEPKFSLEWSTFLGGSGTDLGTDITVDSMGNIYIVGASNSSWGNPLNPMDGGGDAFVAKFAASGELLWNTFSGQQDNRERIGVAVDGNENVYYLSGHDSLTKLDANGIVQWRMPFNDELDALETISVDNQGNIYVIGFHDPCRDHGCTDLVDYTSVWKFNSDGVGGKISSWENGEWMHVDDIIVDSKGNIYLTGVINGWTVFVGKFDSNTRKKVWSTPLGPQWHDHATGIALGNNGDIYVTGESDSTWGNPLHSFYGESDAFLAKLNADNGALQWNTFLGGSGDDAGIGVALDKSGHVYISGRSTSAWGNPLEPYHGGEDVFVAELSADGALLRNTFLGGSGDDFGRYGAISFIGPSIAVDNGGNIYVAGNSDSAWGWPLSAYGGGCSDAFLAKLSGNKQD